LPLCASPPRVRCTDLAASRTGDEDLRAAVAETLFGWSVRGKP
jgi:hypothetical protein